MTFKHSTLNQYPSVSSHAVALAPTNAAAPRKIHTSEFKDSSLLENPLNEDTDLSWMNFDPVFMIILLDNQFKLTFKKLVDR